MAVAQQSSAPPAPAILVIDDEDYVADMIASALELEGYTAHVAYNGRDGLARAAQLAVDLLIIDIMLPYISGIELADQLRQHAHTADVPIILISAGARPTKPLPKMSFVAKPFDMDQMMALVRRWLE